MITPLFIIFVIITTISSMFANIGLPLNSQNYGIPIIQTANAANSINNQNTTINVNCDNTSQCATVPANTQTGSIGSSGDGNEINQNLIQTNEQCTDLTSCTSTGTQQADIVNNFDGFVLDFGSGSTNTQINSYDNDVGNDNKIEHQFTQENRQCAHQTGCRAEGSELTDIGSNFGGVIINFGTNNNNTQIHQATGSMNSNVVTQNFDQESKACHDQTTCSNTISKSHRVGTILGFTGGIGGSGNNNTNTQIISQKNSANENVIEGNRIQTNNNCLSFGCGNQVSEEGNIAMLFGPGINGEGNNSTNTQNVNNIESGNKNKATHTSTQENSNCGPDGVCGNRIFGNYAVGNIGSAFINDLGNNNKNTNNIIKQGSNSENTINSLQVQKNSNCKIGFFPNCSNTIIENTNLDSSNLGILLNTGNNNINEQNEVRISSGNDNLVVNSVSEENLGCDNGFPTCANTAVVNRNIGQSSASLFNNAIANDGNNNQINQSQTTINSNNNNELKADINQDNKNCNVSSVCGNDASFDITIGTSQNGLIANSGDNNTISDSLIVVDSNNDNRIFQVADQHNHDCGASVGCVNSAIAGVNFGSVKSNDISNSQDNQNITQATIITDTNNQNNIVQKIVQDNLCRTSFCSNTANLTANVNGQNNQNIEQNLGQNNLCVKNSTCSNNGKVVGVSGSNTQSNICVDGASCNSTGTNNKNTCYSGATCNNTGVNTKLISHGDSCNSGADGSTTICSHGRIVTISPNPNLVP